MSTTMNVNSPRSRKTFNSVQPPKRVQIISDGGASYFKKGQFGYIIAYDKRGGLHWQDRLGSSPIGEAAYLVSKTKDARGGALWFSKDGLRFTKRR